MARSLGASPDACFLRQAPGLPSSEAIRPPLRAVSVPIISRQSQATAAMRPLRRPFLDRQSRHAQKLARVVRHEHRPERERMPRQQHVVWSDQLRVWFQVIQECLDVARMKRRSFVERIDHRESDAQLIQARETALAFSTSRDTASGPSPSEKRWASIATIRFRRAAPPSPRSGSRPW